MDLETLSRVLGSLDTVSLLPTIAASARVDGITAFGALCELRRRGLAVFRGSSYVLPAGMSEPQAQILLRIGERGPRSAPELALLLGRSDLEVRADLRHLATMGRAEEHGGAWQLVTGMRPETARGIAYVLNLKREVDW